MKHNINDKYIGITYGETQMVVITEQQYSMCARVQSISQCADAR